MDWRATAARRNSTRRVLPVATEPRTGFASCVTPRAAVILSHGLWQRRYAGDPSLVGRFRCACAHWLRAEGHAAARGDRWAGNAQPDAAAAVGGRRRDRRSGRRRLARPRKVWPRRSVLVHDAFREQVVDALARLGLVRRKHVIKGAILADDHDHVLDLLARECQRVGAREQQVRVARR